MSASLLRVKKNFMMEDYIYYIILWHAYSTSIFKKYRANQKVKNYNSYVLNFNMSYVMRIIISYP